MMRSVSLVWRQMLPLFALSLVTAGCGGSSPTQPTPQTIALTANVASLTNVGQTIQVSASESLANGASQDVTASCTGWQSDNTGVLTVNSTGLLTAHGSGSATITTTCQGTTAHSVLTVTLKPSTFTLSGVVTDNVSHGILPNIVVQIASGPNAGATTHTDANGSYTLAGLSPGTITVTFSAASYVTTTDTVTARGRQ